MDSVRVDPLTSDAVGVITAIANGDPHAPFRGYLRFGIDRSTETSHRLRGIAQQSGTATFVASDGEQPRGCVMVGPEAAISDHFGVASWSVRHLSAAGSIDRAAVAQQLISDALTFATHNGAEQVSARVSIDDFGVLAAFQDAGFSVADTLMTYLIIPIDPSSEVLRWRTIGKVDVTYAYGGEILELPDGIGDMMSQLLRDHYDLSRFHADGRFDNDLAGEWYAKWCHKAFANEGVDGLMVAFHDGAPVGFICWNKDPFAQTISGTKVYGSGLGASLGFGAYSALVDFANCSPTFQFAEFDVHAANFPVNRVLGRHPAASILRVSHALHYWVPSSTCKATPP